MPSFPGHISTKYAVLAAISLSGAALADARGLPQQVEVQGHTLRLNGEAVCSKFFFPVYSVGLYLEAPSHDARQVLESEQVKHIHLKLLRDVTKAQIVNALRWRLRAVAADQQALWPRFEEIFQAIPDAKEGTDLAITYVPGGAVVLSFEGREIAFRGKELADAFLRIWIGEDAPASGTRPALLGL